MIEDNESQTAGRPRRQKLRTEEFWLPDDAQFDPREIEFNKNLPVARKPRLIVFGGSFDPVHNGHITLAQNVLEHNLGDEVLFIPAAISPLKAGTPAADGQARVEMLELAIADAVAEKKSYRRLVQSGPEQMVQKRDAATGEPVVNIHTGEKVMIPETPMMEVELDYRFSVSDVELRRGGRSYTIDTMNILRQAYRDHEIAFMVGSDCLDGMEKWHKYGELLQQYEIIIYPRPNCPYCPRDDRDRERISLELTERLGARFASKLMRAMLDPAQFPVMDISASDIRAAIAGGGDLSAYLPSSVWDYIQKNHLYTR